MNPIDRAPLYMKRKKEPLNIVSKTNQTMRQKEVPRDLTNGQF